MIDRFMNARLIMRTEWETDRFTYSKPPLSRNLLAAILFSIPAPPLPDIRSGYANLSIRSLVAVIGVIKWKIKPCQS